MAKDRCLSIDVNGFFSQTVWVKMSAARPRKPAMAVSLVMVALHAIVLNDARIML